MRITTRLLPLVPAALAVAAMAGSTLPAGSAAASPAHHSVPGQLSREARADGLTAAGGGRMGWRASTEQPSARSAA